MYSEDTDNSWAPPASDAEDSRDSFDSNDIEIDGWSKTVFPKETFHDGVPEDYNQSSSTISRLGETQQKLQQQQPCLRITRQPEDQHRARYLSEGSRGAIKDRSGASHCTIQMVGYSRPTRLEIFAGTGAGQVAPHPLYRTIPVTGKGGASLTTPCREVISADGIACLEVTLRPEFGMSAVLDCVGILKICTYNVKRRLPKGPKNSSVRLVFRATIPNPTCHTQPLVIQTESEPIVCVQQLGLPEVLKMSLQSATCRGGVDLFIIGRNFDRNTSVVFREYKEDGKLAWSAEATMDKRLLHQCHLVCSLPTYRDLSLSAPVEVSMTLKCGRKSSHPLPFYYIPDSSSYDWAPPTTPVAVAPPNCSNQQMGSNSFTLPAVIQPKSIDRSNSMNSVMVPVTSLQQQDDLGSIADLFTAHDALFSSQLAAANVPQQPPMIDDSLNGGMIAAARSASIDWEVPPRKKVKYHKSD